MKRPLRLAAVGVVEINEAELPSTWQGEVRSFSTREYLVVEDFESYTDKKDADEAVFQTWIDGYEVPTNGSLVGCAVAPFVERTLIHSGRQSMPLGHDNTAAMYSQAKRPFDNPQNWTQHGIQGPTLWFDGDPANVARQMYVKINNAKILYDGEAENLKMPVRQMWCISLADKSVSGGAGGTGKVLIDDLRLYPLDREQIPSKAPGAAG